MATVMYGGSGLRRNEWLSAGNWRVRLEVQGDGTVVLSHDGVGVWSQAQGAADGLMMQGDGNLVAYNDLGTALWSSGTSAPGAYLCLQDDGNLVIIEDVAVWATDTARLKPGGAAPATLDATSFLQSGDALRLSSGAAQLTMQADGNLVLQHGEAVVWASGGVTEAGAYLAVQEDGNLVVYTQHGEPTWTSKTVGHDRVRLTLQDDGNLVLSERRAVWATGTGPLSAPTITQVADTFTGYDPNDDRDPSINEIKVVGPTAGYPLAPDRDLVLLLVEPRLVTVPPILAAGAGPLPDLMPALAQWCADQEAEGRQARILSLDVYRGPRHQDGRTVLAIRSFLQAVRAAGPRLAGVVLVGAFPEAAILRRWVWVTDFPRADRPGHPFDNFTISKDTPTNSLVKDTRRYLQVWPEQVADSSDIVLADLSGAWDRLYRDSVTVSCMKLYPSPVLPPGQPPEGYVVTAPATEPNGTTWYLNEVATVDDVFYIQEDSVPDPAPGTATDLSVTFTSAHKNPEVFEPGRQLVTLVAQPDIAVSRIDAHAVALTPDPAKRDSNGRGFLDADGQPQLVAAGPLLGAPNLNTMITNEQAERVFLLNYFERNHHHRTAAPNKKLIVASIASVDFIGTEGFHFTEAGDALDAAAAGDIRGSATVRDYVRWFGSDADLRVIHAHSSPEFSSFPGAYSMAALDADFSNKPYHWIGGGPTIRPSLDGRPRDRTDWWLHRSLFLTGYRGDRGSLVYHYGCNSPSPRNTETMPYSDQRYGRGRLAYAILFFTDALALVARAKAYNDENTMSSFLPGTRNGTRPWGDGWLHQFQEAADDPTLSTQNRIADTKLPYSWILLGDWTLTFR